MLEAWSERDLGVQWWRRVLSRIHPREVEWYSGLVNDSVEKTSYRNGRSRVFSSNPPYGLKLNVI
jgi:hypothetical protein